MRALVTGASQGIGRATARRLGRDGYEVLVHYRRHRTEAEQVAAEIRSAGGRAAPIGGDLARPEDRAAMVAAVHVDPRPLDVLVHNAGAYPRTPLERVDLSAARELMDVHVLAPLEMTRDLRGALAAARPGRVVFVSSILAFQGARHGAPYAAAKAAVLGLARSLARELAPDVLVNVVAPGSIDTAILADDTPDQRADREQAIPLGRIGRPEEVADAIAFLSARDQYATGSTVHVNGGLRME